MFLFRILYIQTLKFYGEPYAHGFCAVDIFWKLTRRQAIYIACCQDPSRVSACFNDSEDDFDFFQMFLSQSVSAILHESIIW